MDQSGVSMDLETENSPRLISITQNSYSDETFVLIWSCNQNTATVVADWLTNRCLRVSFSSKVDIIGIVVYGLTDLNGMRLSREACTELKFSLEKLFPEAHVKFYGEPFSFHQSKSYKEVPVMSMKDKLTQCAHAMKSADYSTSNQLLQDIKSSSSPTGHASEMTGYCFRNGLEARLNGNWGLTSQRFFKPEITGTDLMKACEVYYEACPVQKASHFLSNQTIIDQIKDKKSVHILDLGIGFGFQWPKLMKQLSEGDGGPPMLRITGVDRPLPGLHPSDQINHVKISLESMAEKFNVPFEYKGIIESNWEDVSIKSLHIHKDEVLIVNCLSHSGFISTDTLIMHGPSDPVLGLIRELNPAAFVHGRADVSLQAPSFISCFNEALLHYSALFNMVDKNIKNPKDKGLLIELFGQEIYNIVAFQELWEVRCYDRGLVQCHVNPDIIKKVQDGVIPEYRNDFVIKEENKNVRLGWKGRMLFTLSVWKPGQTFQA